MLSLNLGPFALPMSALAVAAAAGVAAAAARVSLGRQRIAVFSIVADLVIGGLVCARIGFVAEWFGQYRGSPWAMLDIRDGGFMFAGGVVGVLLVAAWHAWRETRARRPLAVALAAGTLTLALFGALDLGKQRLPSVPLTDLRGAAVDIDTLRAAHPVVVNLWASWCPPCRREMPVLAAAQRDNPGIVFVFVNSGEDAATINGFLARSRIALKNVLSDDSGMYAHAVGSAALPTTLFYNSDGTLADTNVGGLSEATLASKLARLTESPQRRFHDHSDSHE